MPQRKYPKTPALTLQELEVKVHRTEQALGSITEMDSTKDHSCFTFDGGAPPSGKLKLVQKVAGTTVKPPGSTEICEGKLWNTSAKVDAVAYRLAAE